MSYTGLSKLTQQYAGKPFVVLMFPCNQYMNQEPHANNVIEKFVRGSGKHSCGLIYCNWNGELNPNWPLFAKCNVKPDWCTGGDADCSASSSKCCSKNDAVWKWLNELYPGNPPSGGVPKWNWAGKHLFDASGKPYKYINDETLDPVKLSPDIDHLLAQVERN